MIIVTFSFFSSTLALVPRRSLRRRRSPPQVKVALCIFSVQELIKIKMRLLALFLLVAFSNAHISLNGGSSFSSGLQSIKPSDGIEKIDSKILCLRGGSTDAISAIDWRFFVAGGLCASISHGVTTPLDVIKTKMQQSPGKYKSGMLDAARTMIQTEGAMVLTAGLAPTVVGYGIEGAIKFGLYEAFKTLLAPLQFLDKFTAKLLASVIAGAFAAVLLCPMEEARIKMVGDASWAKENLISAMTRLLLEGGLLSTFVGLPAMLLKQIPYTMGKQVSFDILAEAFYSLVKLQNVWTAAELKWTISIASAFFASIAACLLSQPGDVLLTMTYEADEAPHGKKSAGTKPAAKGIGSLIKSLHAQQGLSGFFLGLQARLSHVASIITTQLVINDVIKTALGLPATGSH